MKHMYVKTVRDMMENLNILPNECSVVYQPGPGFWAIGTKLGGKYLQ